MKHVCKMNTVVLKSFNDRLKIATVSALMAGTFLCVPFTVYAESPSVSGIEQTVRNITVKGVVVDAGGEPVIGASVQLKGAAGVGTITDVDGKFTLPVPANGVLQISYDGYVTPSTDEDILKNPPTAQDNIIEKTYKCKIEVEIEVNERSGAANYFCYETEEVEYQVRFVASRVLS